MWCDHPFSQETRQQKEQWVWGLAATEGSWTKFEKGVCGGSLHNIGEVRTPLPTMYYLDLNSKLYF